MLTEAGAVPPPIRIKCGSVLTVRQLLLGSDALTLLSPDQLAVELTAGVLVALPTPVPVTRTIGVTTRAEWRPTAPQVSFVEFLRQIGVQPKSS